ncbi:MAG: 30S ribosomal protein S6 [Actinomycetota bacterium]
MRAYELMVIINGNLEESVAHSWLNTITKSVQTANGTVHGTPEWWGKRRLAYPIKKQDDGYYAVFNITAAGGALDDTEGALRIADEVLLHKLIRLPDDEAARRGMTVSA